MTKYCVIPQHGEYIMGTYHNADAECIGNGGHVEDRSTGCSSSKAVDGGSDGGADATPLGAASLAPLQTLRDRLPETEVLVDLTTVNESEEMLRILDDGRVRAHLADVVGMASQFSLLALTDPGSPTLSRSHYTDELHAWLVELADAVRERTDDEELRGAVDRLVDHYAGMVGQPVGELVAELQRDAVRGS